MWGASVALTVGAILSSDSYNIAAPIYNDLSGADDIILTGNVGSTFSTGQVRIAVVYDKTSYLTS